MRSKQQIFKVFFYIVQAFLALSFILFYVIIYSETHLHTVELRYNVLGGNGFPVVTFDSVSPVRVIIVIVLVLFAKFGIFGSYIAFGALEPNRNGG